MTTSASFGRGFLLSSAAALVDRRRRQGCGANYHVHEKRNIWHLAFPRTVSNIFVHFTLLAAAAPSILSPGLPPPPSMVSQWAFEKQSHLHTIPVFIARMHYCFQRECRLEYHTHSDPPPPLSQTFNCTAAVYVNSRLGGKPPHGDFKSRGGRIAPPFTPLSMYNFTLPFSLSYFLFFLPMNSGKIWTGMNIQKFEAEPFFRYFCRKCGLEGMDMSSV